MTTIEYPWAVWILVVIAALHVAMRIAIVLMSAIGFLLRRLIRIDIEED